MKPTKWERSWLILRFSKRGSDGSSM